MGLRTLRSEEFVRRIHTAVQDADKRFAFFLGAGCSASSGIKTAGELVQEEWLPRLYRFAKSGSEALEDWVAREFPDFDPSQPALAYGDVMERLFLQPEERQREIEHICDGKFPGFGYAVLAALMALPDARFNVALTVNFDDLIADAMYLYTPARPLVIQHASLATFIRPTRTRPLVVKLHGDNRLAPLNTSHETDRLQMDIEKQVSNLLHDRGLVFLGYGGNDTGITRMLRQLPDQALPLGVYWVGKSPPDGPIGDWLDERDAIVVEKSDFDELMLLFRDAFELPHPNARRFDDVFRRYNQTYERLSGRILARPGTEPDAAVLRRAIAQTDAAAPDWWRHHLNAQRLTAQSLDAADEAYRTGLEEVPRSASLWANYAMFLESDRRDLRRALDAYENAISIDPERWIYTAFADFLEDDYSNYDRAEELYERAISADSVDSFALARFADFLWDARRDSARARVLYEQSIAIDDEHAWHYAVFIAEADRTLARARTLFERNLSFDPGDPYAGVAFADFIADHERDFASAAARYRDVEARSPDNEFVLRRHADFLAFRMGDLAGADDRHREAIRVRPHSWEAHMDYGDFLADYSGDLDRAQREYEHALDLVPSGPEALSALGDFLIRKRNNADGARELLERAIESAPRHADARRVYADFLTMTGQVEEAEREYERAHVLAPYDATISANYAALLFSIGEMERGDQLREHAFEIAERTADDVVLIECGMYELLHGDEERRETALCRVKAFLNAGVRSRGWSFDRNIARARTDGHEHVDWVERLAAVITRATDPALLDGWDSWEACNPRPESGPRK